MLNKIKVFALFLVIIVFGNFQMYAATSEINENSVTNDPIGGSGNAYVGYVWTQLIDIPPPPSGPGTILPASSSKIFPGSVIKTDFGASDITDKNGNFIIVQKSGICTITVWTPGYQAESLSGIEIPEGDTTQLDFSGLKQIKCQSPTALIVSPSSITNINKGESVNFQGNAAGGNAPYEYFWYFGGAPNSDKQNPGNVVFNKPDNPDGVDIFHPVLYVKDADGCVGKSESVTVNVKYVPHQPDADSGGGGCFIQSVF